jgi:hypothetical protein
MTHRAAHVVYATDTAGNALNAAKVEMRRYLGNALVTLYDGPGHAAGSLGSQATTDANGKKLVWIDPGRYNRRVFTGASEDPTTEQIDVVEVALGTTVTGINPQGEWAIGETYNTGDLVTHADGGDAESFISLVDDNLGNEPDAATPGDTVAWMHYPTEPGAAGASGSSDVTGTSTTSLTIAEAERVFTVVEDDRGWAPGVRLRASSDADPTVDWMEGVVTAYSGNTLTMTIDLVGPAADGDAHTDWTINLAGEPGAAGADGTIAGSTGATDNAILLADGVGGATLKTSGRTLESGVTVVFNQGTKSTGTFTPEPSSGRRQRVINGGAHTLAPPTEVGDFILVYTNNGSAGTITTSGFDLVLGDDLDTTDTNRFELGISNDGTTSILQVTALQ